MTRRMFRFLATLTATCTCAVLETLTEYSGYDPKVQVSSDLVVLLAIHVFPWNKGHMIEVGSSSLIMMSIARELVYLCFYILCRELLEIADKCAAAIKVLGAPLGVVAKRCNRFRLDQGPVDQSINIVPYRIRWPAGVSRERFAARKIVRSVGCIGLEGYNFCQMGCGHIPGDLVKYGIRQLRSF